MSAACGQPHHRKVLTAWVDQMERQSTHLHSPQVQRTSLGWPRHAAPRCLTTNGEHELRPANEAHDQEGPQTIIPFLLSFACVQDQQSHHVTAAYRIKRAAAPEPNASSSVLVLDPCPFTALLIYIYIHHREPSALL